MKTHSCIKCQTQYKSKDEDPYYCEPCMTVKNDLAKEIDAKMGSTPKKHVPSTIQILESGGTVAGPHGSRLFSRGITHGK